MNYKMDAYCYGRRLDDGENMQDIIRAYETAYEKAIKDVLALSTGEVINGVIKNMIDVELVKKLLTK